MVIPPPRLRLGSYEPLLELAAGGMAVVFVARQVGAAGFERLVVLKRIHPHLLEDPAFHDSLRDEARIASMVRHPNVVSVSDVVDLEDELLLVMDYVESVSLQTLTTLATAAGARLPPAVVARVAADVLAGLHAAHEARDMRGTWLEVVHRDVSPQNVIVGVDGAARLIDFGIAKAATSITRTTQGAFKGKFAYMSPEQALGTPIDRRSDVFAAGTVVFEALTGQRLFSGSPGIEALHRVVNMPIPSPSSAAPDVSKALDVVVRRALARERDARFQTAADFQEALERAQPPATAREVAAWVEKIAGARLTERRTRLFAILEGRAEPRLPSVVARGATSSEAVPAIAAPEPPPAPAPAAAPPRGGRLRAYAPAGFAAAAIALALGLVFARPGPPARRAAASALPSAARGPSAGGDPEAAPSSGASAGTAIPGDASDLGELVAGGDPAVRPVAAASDTSAVSEEPDARPGLAPGAAASAAPAPDAAPRDPAGPRPSPAGTPSTRPAPRRPRTSGGDLQPSPY